MSASKVTSDLLRGNTDTMILRLLTESDCYGYEIVKLIVERSHGEYELKEATMYSSVRRLEADGDITYERGENHLFFEVGGRMLISRMIDGQFPAYERVIPKGNDKDIEFERERLTNAVKRVALLSNERSRAVKFEIDKGKVEVTSSSSEFGEAREQLAVDYQGTALAISFNAQYVLDFLNVVETELVSLSLKDERWWRRPLELTGFRRLERSGAR